MTGELHPHISPILYIGGACWAFAYDTIYGFQVKFYQAFAYDKL